MRQLLGLIIDASIQILQVKACLRNARCASKRKFENLCKPVHLLLPSNLPHIVIGPVHMSTLGFLIGQLDLSEGATNSNHLESAQCAPAVTELFNTSIKYEVKKVEPYRHTNSVRHADVIEARRADLHK